MTAHETPAGAWVDYGKKTWSMRLHDFYRLFFRGNWLNVLSVLLVLLVVFCAIFADLIVPYDPVAMEVKDRLQPPSQLHLMGTDQFGRDILSRVIAGARVALVVAVMVLTIAAVVGFVVGSVAGLLGGWVDEVLMRITDLFMAFPALILAMAIAATLGPSLQNTMIALSVVYWPWYARLVRAQVLSLREREFVVAARSIGASTSRLIGRHLLPNAVPILITQVTIDVGYVVLSTSGLSFLGLGAQPPTPEWGAMITEGRTFMREAWWYVTFPGVALSITVLGFNLLGDGLRDYLDPRVRKS
jgi:peptide/nickel transport system permease protein